jgi:uncharacterized protein YjeT (DUF2065 family)
MKNRYRILMGLWIGLLATSMAAAAWAQQPSARARVKAIQDANPNTPTEWIEAARSLAELDRPDLARRYLRQVLQAKLDERALAGLADRFGIIVFKRMATRKDLAPEAQRLVDAIVVATKVKVDTPEVQAILETHPRTPADWARAAKIMVDLERPDLAKGFLQQILRAGLDRTQLAALGEQYGTAMFLSMTRNKELAPEAKQLADAVLTATREYLEDPRRLAELIGQLQDPAGEVRARAVAGLRKARGAAVGVLVDVLADPGRAAEHPTVRAALATFGSEATRPLLGILEAPDAKLVVQAIQILAAADARRARVYLLAPFASPESPPEVQAAAEAALKRLPDSVPNKAQAASVLAREARKYYDRRQPLAADAEGRVVLWRWDPAKKRPVAKRYEADEASLAIAARLAREAMSIVPKDEQIRRLYLATMLEQAAYEAGLDKPPATGPGTAAARAAEFGADAIEDVLEDTMAGGHMPAAAVAARILGRIGTAEELLVGGTEPAPLVLAVRSADRRLRFAAAEAIMDLQPARPFAGSSHVLEALGYFVASAGTRRAMVATPSTETSRRIGGFLVELGYDVDTAVTGREMIQQLLASADYELALVDVTIERPAISFLVQQLRRDCRTAGLPVGILATSGRFEQGRRIARRNAMTKAFARPHDAQAVQWQVKELIATAGRRTVSPERRRQQAARALERLAELGGREQSVYDLRRVEKPVTAALYIPPLGAKAVAVLEHLGTPESQQAMVDLAGRFTQPLELRKAAGAAFRNSAQKHGILLSTRQIVSQYDRYNQSENLDTGTQQVLGAILDCIEAHRKGRDENP